MDDVTSRRRRFTGHAHESLTDLVSHKDHDYGTHVGPGSIAPSENDAQASVATRNRLAGTMGLALTANKNYDAAEPNATAQIGVVTTLDDTRLLLHPRLQI